MLWKEGTCNEFYLCRKYPLTIKISKFIKFCKVINKSKKQKNMYVIGQLYHIPLHKQNTISLNKFEIMFKSLL